MSKISSFHWYAVYGYRYAAKEGYKRNLRLGNVTATSQTDATRRAKSAFPGWVVTRVVRTNDLGYGIKVQRR